MSRLDATPKMPLTLQLNERQVLFVALLSRSLSCSPSDAVLHLLESARLQADKPEA